MAGLRYSKQTKTDLPETEIDPVAVARLENSSFARRRGSTPAQRAGLDPNYTPGYGTPAANNRPAGLTPESDWRDLFKPKMGGEGEYTPPNRYANFKNVFRGNDGTYGFGQSALNRNNNPVPMPTITEEQANADMTASATPATAETMSPSGTGAPISSPAASNRFAKRPGQFQSPTQAEAIAIGAKYRTPGSDATRLTFETPQDRTRIRLAKTLPTPPTYPRTL